MSCNHRIAIRMPTAPFDRHAHCELPEGHPGMHHGRANAWGSNVRPVIEWEGDLSTPCEALLSLNGDENRFRCTAGLGHRGRHQHHHANGDVWSWGEAGQ